jgi:5-methylcytosine-specific restriction endonuclease McrA
MSRCPPEWIGATDDAKVPARVRLRIFERAGGICHISKRPIRAGEAWDVDHIIALCNGGEHRESNMAPALTGPHRRKTKADVAEKAMTYRKRANHLGLKRPGAKIQSAGFPKRIRTHAGRPPVRRWSDTA